MFIPFSPFPCLVFAPRTCAPHLFFLFFRLSSKFFIFPSSFFPLRHSLIHAQRRIQRQVAKSIYSSFYSHYFTRYFSFSYLSPVISSTISLLSEFFSSLKFKCYFPIPDISLAPSRRESRNS